MFKERLKQGKTNYFFFSKILNNFLIKEQEPWGGGETKKNKQTSLLQSQLIIYTV